MKNVLKAFGIIALVTIIGFSFAACGDDSGGGGGEGNNPQTETYTGTSGGTTYTLKITENTARYTAQNGDGYELTAGSKKSTGKVNNVAGSVLTLKPSREGADSFTATVSGSNLTNLSGNTTWDDGTPFSAPGALTGSTDPGTGGNSKTWTVVADSKFDINTVVDAIAYGNDKFVAGSRNGKMAYSSDGVTWTAVTDSKFGTSPIYGIVYGNDKFVAVGDSGKIAYSSNGINWTAVTTDIFDVRDDNTHTTTKQPINGIAYGNGIFVAGGLGALTGYSTDGVTWRGLNSGPFYLSTGWKEPIKNIAFGNSTFVSVGGGGMSSSGIIAYSTLTPNSVFGDPIMWNKAENGPKYSNMYYIKEIAYGNGLFVVVNSGGYMATSSDGITWTEGTTGSSFYSINVIAYGNNTYIATGSSICYYSSDCITWTSGRRIFGDQITNDEGTGYPNVLALAYGNGKFVAGGGGGKIAYLSAIKTINDWCNGELNRYTIFYVNK